MTADTAKSRLSKLETDNRLLLELLDSTKKTVDAVREHQELLEDALERELITAEQFSEFLISPNF